MKIIICLILVGVIAQSLAEVYIPSEEERNQWPLAENGGAAASAEEDSDLIRYRKSAYAPAKRTYGPAPSYAPAKPSYSAPAYPGPAVSYTYPSPGPSVPCSRNLLFSCAPSVAPVPCAAPPAYAPAPYAASYSEPIPTYALPQPHYVVPTVREV